jgi:hypothetical protein
MKLFFYKSILVFSLFIIAVHFSFGLIKNEIKREFNKLASKENAEQFKNKVREEMKNAVNKDDFIDKEDAMLINKFFSKIRADLAKND